MKTQFTAGPWQHAVTVGGHHVVHDSQNHCVLSNTRPGPEQCANARLIAAAPTLLSAARGALAALTQNKTFPADIALAISTLEGAIKQATQS